MDTRPEIAGVTLEPVDIDVHDEHGFLAASLPNGKSLRGSSMLMLLALQELAFWDHLRSHAAWPLVHGASLAVDGKRILLIGDKGLGKSTLCMQMLAAGHAVEGDEHVAVGAGIVVARPRTLRVKPGTFSLIRGLPPGLEQSPMLATWDGVPVYSIDPSAFGRPWRISEGPVHACILLESNRGGRSVAKRESSDACFAALMSNGHFGSSNVLQLAARFRTLAASVPAYSLRLGDLAGAQWHLETIAAS